MNTARYRSHLPLAVAITLVAAVLFASPGGAALTQAQAGKDWWNPGDRPSPDSQINVSGAPFKGTDANGDVRGYVDAHNHLMTNEAFGGKFICGKPFSEAGIADALKDCPEHALPAGQYFDLAASQQVHGPDEGGWPDFTGWPNPTTKTHQQNYYAWLERAWRGGQRVLVNDLTTNAALCTVLVAKDRGCDEMESIRLQARKSREMETHIDDMYGGPGKGWFRIVTDPGEATEVVKQGKLAVVLGVETSEPFGCKQYLGVPQCTKADIEAGLDEFQELGISSSFVCHKYDNALCGVRFDAGAAGTAIQVAQFLSTGTFWKTEQCTGPEEDNPITSGPVPPFLADLLKGTPLPVNSPEHKCNVKGLTDLGEYAVRGMIERNMIIEIDHMSVMAAKRTLDILEAESYPGVISSHSWMDVNFTERLYQLGGFQAEYAKDGDVFLPEWQDKAALRKKYDVGYGLGVDLNGVGGHPMPRGADAPNKVEYPFRGFDGKSVLERQVTGERTWDFNLDGLTHIGLLPDWIEQMRRLGGNGVVQDLARGAQSYLDTWCATVDHGEDGAPACPKSKPAGSPSSEPSPGESPSASPNSGSSPSPSAQPGGGGSSASPSGTQVPAAGGDVPDVLPATGAARLATILAIALGMLAAGLMLVRRARRKPQGGTS